MPSGLRVVTEQMASSRAFSVGFFVGVGSRSETDRLHGASHFLEHVLFKGTPTRSAEEISGAIETVGGDLNAYTAKEHTCFYARVLADDADLAVEVLADMITNSVVSARDVDAERAVILDEIAMHADDPGEQAQELVTRALLGDVGLGRPVIGSVRSIKSLRTAQITGYWRRHYVPSEIVVAVAGAVDHDRLVEQLAAIDVLATRTRTRRTPRGERLRPTALSASPGVVVRTRQVEQATAVLALPGPGLFDDDRYALGLLGLVLGGGMSSRLFVEVRERRGLAYGIEAGEVSYTDAGIFSVDWQCAPDRLAEIGRIVTATLADVAEHGVTEDELARSKGQMRGQTVLGYEGPGSRMSRLGSAALTADERGLDELLDLYDAVDADDVQRAAAALFGHDPVLGVVGPKISRRKLDAVLRPWG
ncbi:MAG: M16 family metallopeptidase [Propionibacteriaceae bacterium]